ncbi:Aryl-alcohol dehydrogenase (NADP(+)) [Actinobacteria bacterium OK074]|nr:Aryl-alcohol dehydrogenase (NADP(+)) [Actinobacteria bacterium OK074]
MEQRRLGRSGLRVSELCLGTLTFTRENEEEAHRVLDAFAEAGGTFVDTADVYGNGVAEEVLGRWLKGRRRDGLVIATKVCGRTGPAPNDAGLSRKHVLQAVDASLRRLGTDYIDLYQTHLWDPATPLTETLSTLDTLVRSGKVRYLGAGNLAPAQLQKSLDLADQHGWERYVCLQPLYNLLHRELEWDLLPTSRAEGLGVVPWSPLDGGRLSGRHHHGQADDAAADPRVTAPDRQVLDAVLAVAAAAGRTPAQVALRWLLGRPGVTAPAIGVRHTGQLADNLGALGWELTAGQRRRLDEASARPLPHPYDLLHRSPPIP